MVSARTVAVVLIVVGAAAFAFPTLASEGFNTERPTSFAVGSEDDALIGSEENGETVTHPRKGPRTVTVGRLINNFDSELSLDYRVRTDDSAIRADTESTPVDLDPGENADITARCRGNGGQGTAGVTATVTSAYADGVGVESAEFDFTVEYDCSPPKKGDGSDGNSGSGQGGESETVNEYCADNAVGEDETENETEKENSRNKYKYKYTYDYDYKNGKYRYEYDYEYEWTENANQDPSPNPSTTPDQSLDCVSDDDDVDIDINPDPDPDPDPPDS